jgi:hypothetical protein
MEKSKNKVKLTVTIDYDINEELIKGADKEKRTLSNYVNFLLGKAIKKNNK